MTYSWKRNVFMTREQIREYDRYTIEDLRIPGPVLMENAGRGAAVIASQMCPPEEPVLIVAGPGNNGGDGFVIARHLINVGRTVTTFIAVAREKIAGDALVNYLILEGMGGEIVDITQSLEPFSLAGREGGLLVDALLGTGVTRSVEGHFADIIGEMNSFNGPVLAVDIPSGLDCDTGSPWGMAVEADATATFGHLKRGLLLYPGARLAGELELVSIGAPGISTDKAGWDGEVIEEETVRTSLPHRTPSSHKGTYGHLLLLAGSLGKSGAAVLAGRAAMRSGAGLVTLATTSNAQPVIEPRCMEVMVDALLEKSDAPLTEKVMRKAARVLEGKSAIALGPGLTTAPGIAALAMKLLQSTEVPAVVDADGVNILANDPSGTARITAPLVLTPHPGEMAGFINKTVPAVQADRIGVTREAAKWHKMVIVLKGANSVIASPDGKVFVNPTGNPGMASGGMGDVLTGIVGALLAQGLSPLEAALCGTYLHGLAGDRAALALGEPSLVASDVIDILPEILREWSVRA